MKEPRQIFKRGILGLNIYVRIYIDARFVYTAKYRETKGSFLNINLVARYHEKIPRVYHE